MVVTLSPSIADKWEVEKIIGKLGHPHEEKGLMPYQPARVGDKEKEKGGKSVWALSKLEPKQTYTLDIYLAPRGKPTPGEIKSVLDRIEHREAVKVAFYSREKNEKQDKK